MFPSYASNKLNFLSKIPIFKYYLKTNYIKREKDFLRGYKLVNKKFGFKYLDQILEDLSACPLEIKRDYKKGFLKKTDIEISLRQHTTQRLFYDRQYSFNTEFYISIYRNKAILYPLPLAYINLLSEKGIKVCKLQSIFLWKILILLFFISAIKDTFLYLINNLKNLILRSFNSENINTIDAYFFNSVLHELPDNLRKELKFNIFTCVYEKIKKTKKTIFFAHDLSINLKKLSSNVFLVYRRYPFGYLKNKIRFAKLTIFFFKELFLSPFYFFTSYWWKLYIFNDLFFAEVCNYQNHNNLSKLYLFEHAQINRPLWTYVAIKKGSEIISYFYSGNTSPPTFNNSIPTSQSAMFSNLNWPNYFFWDKYQADFFKDVCIKPYKAYITGPICKQIKPLNSKTNLSNRSISIFDISPLRDTFWRKLAQPNNYYRPYNCVSFFEDILFLCIKHKIQMVIKLKRKYRNSSDLHPSYRNFLHKLKDDKNVFFIDPSISPYPLIKSTTCSIAMPFTSTPIISNLMKKPVCYYDPNAYVSRTDAEARGVEIIIGIKELENWIVNNI